MVSKAVITGASGFIGQALVRQLVESGWDTLGVDSRPVPIASIRSRIADIATPGALDGILDQDTTIFHLAASADVAGSVADPRKDFEANVHGLFQVLEAARAAGCRVIFPSTASVFDCMGNRLPFSERAFPRPTSPYAAGKLAGEAYCYAYHRSYGLDIRVARLFSVYGEGMTRFAIHDIVRKIQSNPREISILGDGNQVRDYLYIDDAVRGLEMIAKSGKPGEDYNLAGGSPVRLMDLARKIACLMGHPDVAIVPTGLSFPGDTPRWFGEISKIRSIGFEPQFSLMAGLERTIAWLVHGERLRRKVSA